MQISRCVPRHGGLYILSIGRLVWQFRSLYETIEISVKTDQAVYVVILIDSAIFDISGGRNEI
jgi:hypothetical protein